MVQIKRKTALVTAAVQPIGRGIALDLAAHGWSIAVHFNRSKEAAEELVTAISRRGGRAIAVQANLEHEDSVEHLVPEVSDRLGHLLCLVNSAGLLETDDLTTLARQSWERHMEVNLRAPMVLGLSFAKVLPDGETGNIINILDHQASALPPDFLSYTVSQSALWTLTRTLATALAPRIRVNAIAPGPLIRADHRVEPQPEAEQRPVPLQRRTSVHDISDGVRYLLAAPSLTGQMLALDGGEHLDSSRPSSNLAASE